MKSCLVRSTDKAISRCVQSLKNSNTIRLFRWMGISGGYIWISFFYPGHTHRALMEQKAPTRPIWNYWRMLQQRKCWQFCTTRQMLGSIYAQCTLVFVTNFTIISILTSFKSKHMYSSKKVIIFWSN